MLKILDAKIEDVDKIYNLLEKNFTYEKLSKKDIEDYVNNKTGLDYVKNLYIDDDFLGVIIYRINDIAELINICIDENYRHQELGDYLLKLMLFTIDTYNINVNEKYFDENEKQNHLCKKVLLEVRSQNIYAIKLYQKENFKQIDIRKNYYKNPDDDCIVMERLIKC